MSSKKHNILFIVPPVLTYEDWRFPRNSVKCIQKGDGKFYGNLVTDMPLGVLSLSAYIKNYNKEVNTVRLIDFNVELNRITSFDYTSFYDYYIDYFDNIEIDKISLVCLTVQFSPAYKSMINIAKVIKKRIGCTVMAGGHIPTSMWERIFKDTQHIDYICYGEGEKPLLKYLNNQNEVIYNDAWITRDKLNDKSWKPKWDYLDDLDDIPLLDYEICEKNYDNNPAFLSHGNILERSGIYHIFTSLGCPFKCIFCASHRVHGRKMRSYSIGRVKKDLSILRDKYGAKVIVIQDDHFLYDKKRALEIIRYIHKLKLTVHFQNSLSISSLNFEFLSSLVDAGVKQLVLPIESGSQRILKNVMKKPLKLESIKRVIGYCDKLNLYTYCSVLIGLPGETKDDIEESLIFLKKLRVNWFGVFIANPLVGSEMFDICLDNNYLSNDWIGSDFKRAVINTPEYTADYIEEKAYLMNLDLNFVNNSDLLNGNYLIALKGFCRAISANKDHMFAYYYSSKCYEGLGDADNAKIFMERAKECLVIDYWKRYFDFFGLKL